MARISGIELNEDWAVLYALTKFKGIGWSTSRDIVETLKLDPEVRVKNLSKDDVSKLTAKLTEYDIEGDLIRKVRTNIQRLREIGAYRGMRHARGLPVRGQRTRSNARTKRGKRRTVGAFKKEELAKQTQAK